MACNKNTNDICTTLYNSAILGQKLIQSRSMMVPSVKPANIFDEFLCKCMPPEWYKKIDYTYKNYTYFQLHQDSEEFQRIRDEFEHSCRCYLLKLKKIVRIQHPFAYFSFLMRCRQIRELCNSEPQVERVFIPINRDVFNDEMISYNLDFRRIKENKGNKKGYVVVVMKILKDYRCDSWPIIYEEVKDHEKYPEYLITLDEDVNDRIDFDEVIDLENYCSVSPVKPDSTYLCFSKYLGDFCDVFDIFPETKGLMLLNSFKYPMQRYIYHVTLNCKCSKCILTCFPNNNPKMPLPFICTKNHLKFWNILLNY